MTIENLKLERQICHRLYVVSNAMTRAYRPFLEKLALTYPQYVVMMALWENPETDIKALIKQTYIDGGALSLILKKMSDKGLLELKSNNEDKRKKMVSLTVKGRQLEKDAADIPGKLRCYTPSISDEQAEQFRNLLDIINHDLHPEN